ncbi:hypothetical protein BAE44_0026235, partial [Dichanthelium oligosanthes]
LASSEAMWALYERWREHFKQERDHEEMVRLFPRFKETVQRVHEVNNSNLPYKLQINKYTDGKLLDLITTFRITEEDIARYKAQGFLDDDIE